MAFEYLLEHGTSEMKKKVLESLIDSYEGLIKLTTKVPDEILELKNRIRKVVCYGDKLKELPLCITKLELVESLNLGWSNFSKLPKEISELRNLKTLILNLVSFKKFPLEILGVHGLETLGLHKSKGEQFMTEINRISQLKSLKELDLKFNQISEFPMGILELENLESLNLSYIGISRLPDEMKKLKKLKNLSLMSNPIHNFPMEILELENLEELDIANIGITELPDEIKRLKNLKVLNLHCLSVDKNENKFEAFLPAISGLVNLEELGLNLKSLKQNLEIISSLTNLKRIIVRSKLFNDIKIETLSIIVKEKLPQCEVTLEE